MCFFLMSSTVIPRRIHDQLPVTKVTESKQIWKQLFFLETLFVKEKTLQLSQVMTPVNGSWGKLCR